MEINKPKYQVFTAGNIDKAPPFQLLTLRQRLALQTVSAVLPFQTNNYVIEHLIDWDNIPEDPMFQMTFPQEGMLSQADFKRIYGFIQKRDKGEAFSKAVNEIRFKLNPHPAGQRNLNIPILNGIPQQGMQHKYRETLLFFPSQGQTCHTYCMYCFRWAQFVGLNELKFANHESQALVRYVQNHPEIRDILFTGGDPMIMGSKLLRRYIEPLLKIKSVRAIRIGTKSLAWWPYRFVTDDDADDILRLFEEVIRSGKQLAIMAHYSHPRELSTPVAELAVRRLHSTGANIRCQAPLVRHVNDSPNIWARLWQKEVDLGAVPYYMFVERNTGARRYFNVPLFQAFEIFSDAYEKVSGLGRTVRGPVMSALPGKVHILGISRIMGKRVFVLRFIQGRDPHWTNQIFYAKYNLTATWLDDLKPAFDSKFFFTDQLKSIKQGTHPPLWENQNSHIVIKSPTESPKKGPFIDLSKERRKPPA
jgi:KamA family protein